ncbi:MAG TPA: cyclic nucleotide-binding domain-containing protein [Elusimicrobiota bacterium]|nr:cyclic nucleotide-binding domain-containing protein [Elusimicrobiota bacterium]
MKKSFKDWWNRSLFWLRDQAFRSKKEFLRQVFIFKGLSNRALALIAQKVHERGYADGEIIFHEGDIGRAFFIVVEGRVELYRQPSPSGTPDIIGVLGPGDFFGEMVLLDELPRSASARAIEPSKLFLLYKSNFDAILREHPDVGVNILHSLARLLSARLRRQTTQLYSESPSR